MARPLRLIDPQYVYFVTSRTLQSRFFLRPSRRINDLVGGVLARAARLFGVEIFAFVVASNHLHLMLKAEPQKMAGFMCFLMGNVARKVGEEIGWLGSFWARRYSAEPILDDRALEDRLRYIFAHGVKERLVNQCRNWPGLQSVNLLCRGQKLEAGWLNKTKAYQLRRHQGLSVEQSERQATELETLELSPLPCWRDLTPQERMAKATKLADEVDAEHREQKTLGVKKVLSQVPFAKPKTTNHSKRPLCHTTLIELWREFRQTYRDFVQGFSIAAENLRNGLLTIRFPSFAFPPHLPSHAKWVTPA